jgi:hypothetical protein
MMKRKLYLFTIVVVSLALFAIAQPSPEIVGRWQGDKMGTPWVTVNVIRGHSGQLSGTAVFYILDRSETDHAPKVLGKQEVALLDPKIAGNIFSFKVTNQQGAVTMNPSSGEALEFKMIVRSDTEATLRSEGQDSLSVSMVKQK